MPRTGDRQADYRIRGQEHQQRRRVYAVERIFSPEFRNRLDGCQLQRLTPEVVLMIVKKAIGEFAVQLKEKSVNIEVPTVLRMAAVKLLRGVRGKRDRPPDPDKIKRFFVDEVLFGKLQKGGIALVDIECDDVTVRSLKSAKSLSCCCENIFYLSKP